MMIKDIESLSDAEKLALVQAVQESVAANKAKQTTQEVGQYAKLVVDAIKKIKADLEERYAVISAEIASKSAAIRDGKDGLQGPKGEKGDTGLRGLDGAHGKDGRDGIDGIDGVNGNGVTDARIDFDGSLIISLSDGSEINAGEVVPFDVAEKIKVIGNGGGTSQYVLDAIDNLQAQIDATNIPSQTGNAGKYLGTTGSALQWEDFPDLTITDTFVVSSQAAMLALSVQKGDVAVRTDLNKTFILTASPASTLSNWQELLTPTDLVTSVAGRTGNVTLSNTDISGLGTMSTQNANNVAITGGDIATTGLLQAAASTTGAAGFKISEGVSPTSPNNGDIWTETGGIFAHTNGFTNQLNVDSNMSGVLSMPTITVTGSGSTISVSSVNVYLFSTSTFSGHFRQYTVPAATGLALVDQTSNYLVVTYNGGSPIFSVTQNVADINGSDVAGAALLFRNGTEVHHQSVNWGLAPASRNNRRLIQTRRYERGMGLSLGESTGRVITLTSGVVWYGVTEYGETAQTSASNNAEFWYHVSGVWTKSTVSTYNNTQYDNGTNLVTLSGAGTQYAVNWVYRYLDGAGLPKLAYVVGTGNYNLAQAVAAGSPTPPAILSQMAILVGRIIVAQNASTATQIDSAFTQVFSGTIVTDHNDLGNLQGGTTDEYYHLTSAEYTGTGTGTFVRSSSPTLVTPALGTPSSGNLANCTFPTLNQNTTGSAGSLVTTGFSIVESGGKLLFKYGATTIASMSSTGVITSATNIVSNGTP